MPVLFVFVFACLPLLFLLYVRLPKSKPRFICRVWALWAGVVCVDVRDVWTQHAPRKRANLARFDVWQVFVWEVSLFCMHYLRRGAGVRAATTVWCKSSNFF